MNDFGLSEVLELMRAKGFSQTDTICSFAMWVPPFMACYMYFCAFIAIREDLSMLCTKVQGVPKITVSHGKSVEATLKL